MSMNDVPQVSPVHSVSKQTRAVLQQDVQTNSHCMTLAEWRATSGLSLLFFLRMCGLFLLLPIFILEARHYPGGDDMMLVGLAFGAYGLAQALFQIPFGLASDSLGRKRVIAVGLLLFIAGSLWAAYANTVWDLLIGRVLQGLGAVSAAITALLADQTRPLVRTKAMAVVGVSIGVSFALSLIAAPLLNAWVGLSGIFFLMAALGVCALALLYLWVPPEAPFSHPLPHHSWRESFLAVLRQVELLRLNVGVFVLHLVQMSMWLLVPSLVVKLGLQAGQHWLVYLPALLLSVLVVGGWLFRLERQGRTHWVFRASIVLMGLAQIGFWGVQHSLASAAGSVGFVSLVGIAILVAILTLFFIGFNALEASQPSLVSKTAEPRLRGAALGVYNTVQALGLFAGGALGGWLKQVAGADALWLANTGMLLLWLWLTFSMQTPPQAQIPP